MINFSLKISAQDFSVNGYVTTVQQNIFEDFDSDWLSSNNLNNRLNFNFYPNDNFRINLEARNRFFWAGYDYNLMEENYAKDVGFFDLTENILIRKSCLLNLNVDRAFVQFSNDKLSLTLGRQRINWGRNLVWNPNDIFNTYSFFEFDYIEKPGADALRLQYFLSMISSIEIAAKLNAKDQLTAAFLFSGNFLEYDIQLLAGIYNSDDFVVGAGWEGNIANAGFKGEMTYLHPRENWGKEEGVLLSGISFMYSFENSISLQTEFLFRHNPNKEENNVFDIFNFKEMDLKDLSFVKYNLFAQVAYPLTPLFNISLSSIYYPEIKGFFLSPSFDYSLAENLDFGFYTQWFSAEIAKERQNMTLTFLRFKYSF